MKMQHGKCENSTSQLPLKNKVDAAAALRAELELELKNKKQCTYQPYECTQLSIDGFKYCTKHILQDKNAPFKQCSYIYNSNGKRCHLPAPRGDRKDYGYCSEHALKATLARNKHGAKYAPPRSAEALLQSLSHYVKKPRFRSTSSSTQHSDEADRMTPDEGDLKATKCQDPFVDLDACSIFNDRCNQILDFCSESESDIEATTFSSVWHDAQADSSGDESIDSEQEDVLKHANVYTAEEITLMTRDKLIRLQSLYIEQYRHLQYLLKEKRRKYIHSLRREKETCCNIYSQVRDNPKEQRLYKKLKALNSYQKCHGTDAILNKRLKDLRTKVSDGSNAKSQVYSKCSFSEGGVKCLERSLPLSKYCQRHILEDANQVLFRACGKLTGDMSCPTPIAAVFDESTCPLHLDIPPLRSYSILRKDSESDIDDTSDAHLNYSHLSDNVKTEFMHYDIPPEIPKMETLPSMLFEENTRSTNESSNDFTFKGSIGEATEMKAGQSDESMEGIISEQVPDCVHEEVEISTEVNESERSLADVSGGDLKTETVDVSDMVVVDEAMDVEMETSVAEESSMDASAPGVFQDESQIAEIDVGTAAEASPVVPSEAVGGFECSEGAFGHELVETETAMDRDEVKMVESVVEMANSELDGGNDHNKTREVVENETVNLQDETKTVGNVEMKDIELDNKNVENDLIEEESKLVLSGTDEVRVDRVELVGCEVGGNFEGVQNEQTGNTSDDVLENEEEPHSSKNVGAEVKTVLKESTETETGLREEENPPTALQEDVEATSTTLEEGIEKTPAVLEEQTEETPTVLQKPTEETPTIIQEQTEGTSTAVEEEVGKIPTVLQEEETVKTSIVAQEASTDAIP